MFAMPLTKISSIRSLRSNKQDFAAMDQQPEEQGPHTLTAPKQSIAAKRDQKLQEKQSKKPASVNAKMTKNDTKAKKPKEEAKKTVAKKVTGAKRGRKPSSALQFTNKSDERIAEFEKVLISGVTPDGEELDSKLTLKYKNRISAQRSRANKKQEVDLL